MCAGMTDVTVVQVQWTRLSDRSPLWHDTLCLYTYNHTEDDKLLYVGKADYHTIQQRMEGPDKDGLFEYFEDEFGLYEVEVFHGALLVGQGRRRSSALLADLESLFILRLRPPGNIMCTNSRAVCRPGLRAHCTGEWCHRRASFHDRG